MADPIRILLVDDQRLMREGLRILLELEPDLEIVGEAGDGQAGDIELVPGNPYWTHTFDLSSAKAGNAQIAFTLENRTGNTATEKLRLFAVRSLDGREPALGEPEEAVERDERDREDREAPTGHAHMIVSSPGAGVSGL